MKTSKLTTYYLNGFSLERYRTPEHDTERYLSQGNGLRSIEGIDSHDEQVTGQTKVEDKVTRLQQ